MHCSDAPTTHGIYLIRSTHVSVYETADLYTDPYEVGELLDAEETFDVYKIGCSSNLRKRLRNYTDMGYTDAQMAWVPMMKGRHLHAERLLIKWMKSMCSPHKGNEWYAIHRGYGMPDLSWINMVKIWSELRKIRHTDDLFAEYHFWECIARMAIFFGLPFTSHFGWERMKEQIKIGLVKDGKIAPGTVIENFYPREPLEVVT